MHSHLAALLAISKTIMTMEQSQRFRCITRGKDTRTHTGQLNQNSNNRIDSLQSALLLRYKYMYNSEATRLKKGRRKECRP